MALTRQKYRELIFQMLFSLSYNESDEEQLMHLMMKQLKITKKSAKDALAYCKKILLEKKHLDEKISLVSKEYALDRIAKVEYTTLLLGIYEILFDSEVPYKASISEAVRLAKKFATKESANFINAILDAIYKKEVEKLETISK